MQVSTAAAQVRQREENYSGDRMMERLIHELLLKSVAYRLRKGEQVRDEI